MLCVTELFFLQFHVFNTFSISITVLSSVTQNKYMTLNICKYLLCRRELGRRWATRLERLDRPTLVLVDATAAGRAFRRQQRISSPPWINTNPATQLPRDIPHVIVSLRISSSLSILLYAASKPWWPTRYPAFRKFQHCIHRLRRSDERLTSKAVWELHTHQMWSSCGYLLAILAHFSGICYVVPVTFILTFYICYLLTCYFVCATLQPSLKKVLWVWPPVH